MDSTTIEFIGTNGIEVTRGLLKALKRYWNFVLAINDDSIIKSFEFIDAHKNSSADLRILSIPISYHPIEQDPEKDPYYSFRKLSILEDLFKGRDKLHWIAEDLVYIRKMQEDISNIGKSKDFQIELLNIQSGNKEYWKKKLNEIIINNSNDNNPLYLFYWRSNLRKEDEVKADNPRGLNQIKRTYSVKDKVWGYSQFLRDFLKKRRHCFEMEIKEIKELISDPNIVKIIKEKYDNIKEHPHPDGLLKESLNVFGKNCLSSDSKITIEDLAELYLYNKNNWFKECKHFETKFADQIQTATGNSHGILREKERCLINQKRILELGMIENKIFFYDIMKNAALAFIHYKEFDEKLKPDFLFLDDISPEKINTDEHMNYRHKIDVFKNWFPGSTFYYCSDSGFFSKDTIDLQEFVQSNFVFKQSYSLNVDKPNPLFIGIDIDWGGEPIGYEILRQYRRNAHSFKRPVFIFVYSRYEYPSDIRKSVASGALFYITKQNYMKLVFHVYSILRSLERGDVSGKEIINDKYLYYENWHLLNKLEPSKIIDLKSSVIGGISEENLSERAHRYLYEYQWIKKLPKADLHCHIGSCLGPEILPFTALLVLSEKLYQKKLSKETLDVCIKFVNIFIDGLKYNSGNKLELCVEKLSQAFGISNSNGCLFTEISSILNLESENKFPEEALLNPFFSPMDTALFGVDPQKHEYIGLRQLLKKHKVGYDDVMLFFIFMIYVQCRETKISYTDIEKDIAKITGSDSLTEFFNKIRDKEDNRTGDIWAKCHDFFSMVNNSDISIKNKICWKKILGSLQSVSGQSTNSLFTYLRGCEYGGAPHLQTKESIYLACYYIVHKYAIPDNIRYLTLRCAVDGYKKSGLIPSNDEAMGALISGLEFAVRSATPNVKPKIHVDIILTAKRHKSIDEFKENTELALKYRCGITDKTRKVQDEKLTSFFDDYTAKVVSFDLAGLERGNRASKYSQQFEPLLKECFPITIHAGEEDSDDAIWDAIYSVHTQRIGHALSLRDNAKLLSIVKDRHIALELCPLSNIYTRKISWTPIEQKDRNNKDVAKDAKYYPLRQYLHENMDVTINTDNPFVSGATLTEEYLVAAKYAGGLTKWEVLRLIKNSFRSASIPREQKRMLMNEIDDEIYTILMEEDL